MSENDDKCFFCNSSDVKVEKVGFTASGYGHGHEASFCESCLKNMTGIEFWKRIQQWEDNECEFTREIRVDRWKPSASQRKVRPDHRERRKITDSLRYRIMRRDSFCCALCGTTGKNDILVVDHILPISKSGKTEESNLRTLCQKFNSGKGGKVE